MVKLMRGKVSACLPLVVPYCTRSKQIRIDLREFLPQVSKVGFEGLRC